MGSKYTFTVAGTETLLYYPQSDTASCCSFIRHEANIDQQQTRVDRVWNGIRIGESEWNITGISARKSLENLYV